MPAPALGTQVGIAFALLQARDLGNPRRDKADLGEELVAPKRPLAQRDFTDAELRAGELEILDRAPVLVAAGGLGSLHQEVDPGGVRHHHDLGLRVDLEMVADVLEAPRRLLQTLAKVIYDSKRFFLRTCSARRKQNACCQSREQGAHRLAHGMGRGTNGCGAAVTNPYL